MEIPIAERILNKLLHGPMQMNPLSDSRRSQDRAVRIIAKEIEDDIEIKLARYEQREAGNEFCEAHEDWLPIEEMQCDSEGTWLCQEAWDELVREQGVSA